MDDRAITRVDIIIDNNSWWDDAFQYGDPIDFSWNFNGMKFFLSIKKHEDDPTAILALTSDAGQIIVQDATNRILAMSVTDIVIRNNLSEGKYIYDLLMVSNATGQTDGLMYGELVVAQGVTIGPS